MLRRTIALFAVLSLALSGCELVVSIDRSRIPDGSVETVAHHGNCEGIVFGDRGDGQHDT